MEKTLSNIWLLLSESTAWNPIRVITTLLPVGVGHTQSEVIRTSAMLLCLFVFPSPSMQLTLQPNMTEARFLSTTLLHKNARHYGVFSTKFTRVDCKGQTFSSFVIAWSRKWPNVSYCPVFSNEYIEPSFTTFVSWGWQAQIVNSWIIFSASTIQRLFVCVLS